MLAVRRDADGVLLEVAADDGPPVPGTVAESWIHVALVPPVDRHALDEAVRMLPLVVADARQVADDSPALTARLRELAAATDAAPGGRFSGPDPADVADLLRWLSEGNFVLLGEMFKGPAGPLVQGYSPMVVRFFLLQAHYRSPVDVSDDALQAARKGYRKLMNGLRIR